MKIKSSVRPTIGAALLLFVCPTEARSATKQAFSLPTEVRSYLPRGATSFLAQRLPIGFEGTKRFVHIWGTVRRKTADSNNSYDSYTSSPFCVDIFEPLLNSRKGWQWRLVSSAVYMDEVAPTLILTHWLHSATRQGPILEVVSSNGAPGVSTRHTLFVWDKGLQVGYTAPPAQTFYSGGSGGGLVEQLFDGVDEQGNMTVTTKNSYTGKLTSTVTLHWNGKQFVAPAIHQ